MSYYLTSAGVAVAGCLIGWSLNRLFYWTRDLIQKRWAKRVAKRMIEQAERY